MCKSHKEILQISVDSYRYRLLSKPSLGQLTMEYSKMYAGRRTKYTLLSFIFNQTCNFLIDFSVNKKVNTLTLSIATYDSLFYCSCRIRHYLISFMIIQSCVTRIPSLMLHKTRYRIKHNGAVWRNSNCKPSYRIIRVLTTLMCQGLSQVTLH